MRKTVTSRLRTIEAAAHAVDVSGSDLFTLENGRLVPTAKMKAIIQQRRAQVAETLAMFGDSFQNVN